MQLLRQGSRGPQVRELQAKINRSKFHKPTLLSEDGVFGRKTHDAVREFQQRSEIKVDGVVGDTTWAYLALYRVPDNGADLVALIKRVWQST